MSLLLGFHGAGSPSSAAQPTCLLLLRRLSSLGASASHATAEPAPQEGSRSSSGSSSSSGRGAPIRPANLAHSLYHELCKRGSLVAPDFVESAITRATATSRQAQHVLAARGTNLPLRNYLANATLLQASAQHKYPQQRVLSDKHRLVMEHIADTMPGVVPGPNLPPALGVERHTLWQGVAGHFKSKLEFRGVLWDLRDAGLLATYPPTTKKAGAHYLYGPTRQLGELWVRLRREAQGAAAMGGKRVVAKGLSGGPDGTPAADVAGDQGLPGSTPAAAS